jgi:hypothetical protein
VASPSPPARSALVPADTSIPIQPAPTAPPLLPAQAPDHEHEPKTQPRKHASKTMSDKGPTIRIAGPTQVHARPEDPRRLPAR